MAILMGGRLIAVSHKEPSHSSHLLKDNFLVKNIYIGIFVSISIQLRSARPVGISESPGILQILKRKEEIL